MSGGPPDSARLRLRLRIALLVGAFVSMIVLSSMLVSSAGAQDDGDGGLIPTSTTTTEPEDTTTTEATTTSIEETTTTYNESTTTFTQSSPVYQAPATTEAQIIETTTSESVTTTTGRNVLIPGDGTEGAESTTTSSTTVVKASDVASSGIDETTKVWLVVAGLVAIALAVMAWTAYYWRSTRPGSAADDSATLAPGSMNAETATKPVPGAAPANAGANPAVRTVLVKNVPPKGR